jgi:phosphoglycolate phosphatase
VPDLLQCLRPAVGVRVGLLTGNFEETGSLKLSACGIDPAQFALAVWGDHSPNDPPDRADLPPLAMHRYRALVGRAIEPRHVTIIGDTPHDVRCARIHGCRSLGVATGRYSVNALLEAGADAAVADLSDTPALLAWLAPARV